MSQSINAIFVPRIGMYIRINMSKTDFFYCKSWCDSVTFCQRGHFFYSPCIRAHLLPLGHTPFPKYQSPPQICSYRSMQLSTKDNQQGCFTVFILIMAHHACTLEKILAILAPPPLPAFDLVAYNIVYVTWRGRINDIKTLHPSGRGALGQHLGVCLCAAGNLEPSLCQDLICDKDTSSHDKNC